MAVNISGSCIIFLFGFWITSSRADNELIKDKLELKADIPYVDKAIKTHEEKEKEVYLRLENLIVLSLEKQESIVESIDKRLERIENNRR
ncbi:MAG: hypothetical protein FK734_05445 [Asgard group archaeon]|nr:hypothetical protein [Asgard group archaeon]